MLKKLSKFAALDLSQQAVFIQAWFMLGRMRLAILLTSFKRLSAGLGPHRTVLQMEVTSPEQARQAVNIGKLVASAASATPWQSRCLVQVLVVQRLLAKRDIPGQFYLGVRKGSDGNPHGMSAHAWLQCGAEIVNGGEGHQQFSIVSTYRWN